MGEHEWVPSTLGHGEMQCKHCLMTNREAWLLGSVRCEDVPPLKPYRVSYHERPEDEGVLYFDCMADDEDHAVEQVVNAYPDCVVINVTEDLRGVTPRTEPELDDVERVLSRVEVLLDTWAMLLDNHPVIEGDDAPDGLHDMSWVAVAAITRLRDELLLRTDKLREPNDG